MAAKKKTIYPNFENRKFPEADSPMKILHVNANIPAAVLLAVMTRAISIMLVNGCGKKGPPVPPTGNRPPKVMDLGYSIRNNTIKLNWTIPRTSDKAKSPVMGFLIYGSKQTAIEADCPNCPIRFKEIGDIPVRSVDPDQGEPSLMVFTQAIEPGYRYIYKVKSYDDDGVAGKDSNLVDFTF